MKPPIHAEKKLQAARASKIQWRFFGSATSAGYPLGVRIPGTLYGSLLFERPEHRGTVARVESFLSRPGPLGVEIGFDHGMCLLDRARRFPAANWLGAEVRRRRVDAVSRHAPENCLPLRVDGRALLALLPPGRVDWLYVLFPTPFGDRRELFSPEFGEVVARSLRPGGIVYIRTDVATLHASATAVLGSWARSEPPPLGTELSRRERVCARDGIAVYDLCVRSKSP